MMPSKISFVGMALSLCVAVFGQASSLDKYLSELIGKAGIPGLSFARIEDGAVQDILAVGMRSNDTGVPVDTQTIFAAASLSKPLFAYGVMKMVEAGLIDLDRPLHEYLTYEDITHDERYKKITARMVLSHSAGFPNWRRDELTIDFEPGARFSYSGEGFVYLQRVVEKLTGLPLDEWMEVKVLQPLHMTRSSYVWLPAFDDNHAVPHNELGITFPLQKYEEPNAAYSLLTTAGDYARFVGAMIEGKGLAKETVTAMLTPQVPAFQRWDRREALSGEVAWGLGWGLEEASDGRYFWHWGDNGPFKALVIASRETGKGLVYFANSSEGLSIVKELLPAVLGGPHPITSWLTYPAYDRPSRRLLEAILAKGVEEAIQPFRAPNGLHQDTSLISEREMNSLGYILLRQNRYREAREVFRMNAEAFPNSSNVYDSFAEACLRSGDYAGAATYYARAAELDADNQVAASIAKQLSSPMSGNTSFTLEGFPHARTVSLIGSFNDWSEWKNLMRYRNGIWECRLDLEPGTYQYKFVVDGIRVLDPANPNTAYEGNHNSVFKKE